MKEYQICGKRVVFPFKPYPSQFLCISAIIKALEKGENALLESPTGSGKSLALLCATLSWQKAERLRLEAEFHASQAAAELAATAQATSKHKPNTSAGNKEEIDSATLNMLESFRRDTDTQGGEGSTATNPGFDPGGGYDDDDDDFVDPRRLSGSRPHSHSSNHSREAAKSRGVDSDGGHINSGDASSHNTKTNTDGGSSSSSTPQANPADHGHDDGTQTEMPAKKPKKSRPKRPPKIFYATRTHKQLEQITKELNRSAYKDVRMTVLSSREQTCIHPRVSKSSNKNEECQQLMEQRSYHAGGGGAVGGCAFYDNVQKLASRRFRTRGWDLEDLVKAGKRSRGCPYFASRELLPGAEIVFCPYNYLIDPIIRASMDINANNAVIIFDEAHNIEDVARDSASVSVTVEDLDNALHDLQSIHPSAAPILYEATGLKTGAGSDETSVSLVEHVQRLSSFLKSFIAWAKQEIEHPSATIDFQVKNRAFGPSEVVSSLESHGIVPGTPKLLQESYNELFKDSEEDNRQGIKLQGSTNMTLSRLITVLTFFFEHRTSHSDFRVVVQQASSRPQRGRHIRQFFRQQPTTTTTVHIWCLNPAVAFRSLAAAAHSILVTSGTLSPMTSFASELDTAFPVKVEASHVVPKKQTWVGALSTGPSGQSMLGTFKNASSFTYQDDLGRVITECCKCVSGGVLVFLPSYSAMSRLVDRWKVTQQMAALAAVKDVFVEPRSGQKEDFDGLMKDFYASVKSRGAVFFAVCRGKASEGIDFSDSRARLVVTVGIPFPNIKDLKVNMKKAYNDAYTNRGLLRGVEWYDIQAFRALNQALGRCIRHRLDWGGLLLIDSRFTSKPRYVQSLSKWIRQRLQRFSSVAAMTRSLGAFAANMRSNPPKAPPPSTPAAATVPAAATTQRGGASSSSSFPSPATAAGDDKQGHASVAVKREPPTAAQQSVEITAAPLGRATTPSSSNAAAVKMSGGFMPEDMQSQP